MINMLKKGLKYITDENYRFLINASLGKYDSMPDEEYLKRKFKAIMGRELNLESPQTFNEKLQWLKLYNRKPEYTMMVDKYKVREYIKEMIGEEYLIPLLGVWDDPDEIDFDALPNKFVLKCNHNSGLGMCICKDKSKLDIPKVKKELRKGLKQDYYLTGREWPYKDVPRKIICEKYMEDNSNELIDYKLFCFDGMPQMTLVCSGRFTKDGLKEDFYNNEWELMNLQRPDHGNSSLCYQCPEKYELMKELASKLSKNLPFERIDFYEINEKVYFGEITFFPASGFESFKPDEWDSKLGEWIELPKSNGGGYVLNSDDFILWIHEDIHKSEDLKDYKFYCFNGEVKVVMINSDRNTLESTKADYFDKQFNCLDFKWGYSHSNKVPEKPKLFDEMVEIAELLSKDMMHVRIDLYDCNNKIYFGEITFFDGSGFDRIEPEEWDYKLGSYIHLEKIEKKL